MAKKKILYHSDFSLLKTGFARTAKLVLTYLYNTGKYDIVQYSCGTAVGNPHFERLPWKNIGTLPNSVQEQKALNKDPRLARMASYGSLNIDEVISAEKPDVYIAVQDIWGIDYSIEKPWFSKINSVVWTTLDSVPILPTAVKAAEKSKNYWVWGKFAEKALHELGHEHVKTVHGPLDESCFYRLEDEERSLLRESFNIEQEAMVIGFVFRNQLRKSVPNLLQGYAKFKEKNDVGKTYLLLHTHFSEGWNILRLAKESGIAEEEILTTYKCKACGNYKVSNFVGQDLDCEDCHASESVSTTFPSNGVTETQLNEIYNLMDVYAHPFTSGGQEIPIQEAKLTELITLVTDYSCGEDACVPKAQTLPLTWHEYREAGTEFVKASTDPESISKQLTKFFKMDQEKRSKWGKKAREWVIDNYSINNTGKFLEEFIDSLPEIDESAYNFSKKEYNAEADLDNSLPDKEWVMALYDKILDMTVEESDSGLEYWKGEMNKGATRQSVETYFRDVARRESKKGDTIDDILDKEDEGRRILFVIPESAGDIYMCTSLFKGIKQQYPGYNLYVACKKHFYDILNGNPHVHKIIGYTPQMDDLLLLEGHGSHKGFFDIAFLPRINTQKHITYTHNAKDKIAFDIKEY